MSDLTDEPSAPAADAVAWNRRFLGTNDALLLKVRAHFDLPLVNVSDEELAEAVFNYQQESDLESPDGKLSPATLARLKQVDGLGSREWCAQLDERDQQALQAVIDEAAELRSQDAVSASELRESILRVAESQIGKVNSLDRGDGRKYGGQRLVQYFSSCESPSDERPLLAANTQPPREWCGIFAVWAINTATGNGAWGAQAPTGLSLVWRREDPALENIEPGDILAITAKNHHFLFVRREGDNLITIDGNGDFQAVHWTSHPAASIVAYYKAVVEE